MTDKKSGTMFPRSTSNVHSRYAADFQDLNDSDGPSYLGENAQYSGALHPPASQNIIFPMTEIDEKEPALSLKQALDLSPHGAMWRRYLPRMPAELRTEMERKLRENPRIDEAFFQKSFDEFSRKTYGPRDPIDRQNNPTQQYPTLGQQARHAEFSHQYYNDRLSQYNKIGMVPANQSFLRHHQTAIYADEQAMPAMQQMGQAQVTSNYYHHRSSESRDIPPPA
ncbi:hypothetical protein N7491_009076 [Penicillium cf. griseofulvum]|uniref:Uncharacterized protein n=1 Tax=Penicillium cf. griseofulvum TaxID=2972120 RepID=A0A9W9MFI8_9EURO|nr:hypothetical protein N7472_005328 [Penicillium cf. griseofulvum]KAJ5423860.1 hypothetical protein N7491_009076 [Penicillium cf. griseofulvum]KAJ5430887.1 hypothetical protein N7445_008619 [Penicillium cf. griseofulvum]